MYLDFLRAHDHNFFRLWMWEQATWVVEWASPYHFAPTVYERTGPGVALDGKPKFDLTRFNDEYFRRLRKRVQEAGRRGLYVSVMLFDGWSVAYPKGHYALANPWLGHPFHAANNINGVDGDPNGDQSGIETHTLAMAPVVSLQEDYVRRVIDAVGDLDNVLYEISNESTGGSASWQYHMIGVVKRYEAARPMQHPVGMTSEWPAGNNADLFASPADWISPNDYFDPPLSDGRKVIIADTDHIWGIGGDRQWAWKCFTRGLNPIFMDQYDDSFKLDGGGYRPDNENDVSLRKNLGHTRRYAERMNLAAMVPRIDVASSGYALVNLEGGGAEYLVYVPFGKSVTVDLSATPQLLAVEWFAPATSEYLPGRHVRGGAVHVFQSPFEGDSVLYLKEGTVDPAAPALTQE